MIGIFLLGLVQVSQTADGRFVDPFSGGLDTPLFKQVRKLSKPATMCVVNGINTMPLSADEQAQQTRLSSLKTRCGYPRAVEVALKLVEKAYPANDENYTRTKIDEVFQATMVADSMAMAAGIDPNAPDQ